jgi:hypothetical protein
LAAAFLPAARCFLVAAAFLAAVLRSVPFFMVSGVYQKRKQQGPASIGPRWKRALGPEKTSTRRALIS